MESAYKNRHAHRDWSLLSHKQRDRQKQPTNNWLFCLKGYTVYLGFLKSEAFLEI